MLDGAGRGLADGRRDLGGAAFGDHDARSAGALGAAADRAEVLRILNLVERDDQRIGTREQLLGGGVVERTGVGADPLVRARATATLDLLTRDDPRTRIFQPWLTGGRCRGPAVTDALRPPAAQRLEDGVAPVEDHRGSSSKPSAPSRTSQPCAAISSRRRSEAAKSRAARACSRCSASARTSAGAASSGSSRASRPTTPSISARSASPLASSEP